jgi:hypothetical protein
MSEYNFERLTVPKPAPVDDGKPIPRVDWLAVIVVAICVIGIVVGLSRSQEPSPRAATWPEAGPSSVFGQTLAPEPVVCPDCTCPDCSYLARFVGALDDAAATPREIRDVLHRCYTESRFSAGAVSSTGDYGICQINAGAHPETDTDRLLIDPVYAAGECLRVYRGMFAACGDGWECCYRFGIRGCKGRVKATNKE